MTTFPTPTRADHLRFCTAEGWTRVRSATGKTGTHHVTFELMLPDGRVLRTRISHPPDRTDYGKQIWSHILRDQLAVAEAEFWSCVQQAILPQRGKTDAPPDEALPAEIVALLINTVGVPEPEVHAMSKQQAIARLSDFWTSGK